LSQVKPALKQPGDPRTCIIFGGRRSQNQFLNHERYTFMAPERLFRLGKAGVVLSQCGKTKTTRCSLWARTER